MEERTVTISEGMFAEKAAKVTDKIMNKFSENPRAKMVMMLSTMQFTAELMKELFEEECDGNN